MPDLLTRVLPQDVICLLEQRDDRDNVSRPDAGEALPSLSQQTAPNFPSTALVQY